MAAMTGQTTGNNGIGHEDNDHQHGDLTWQFDDCKTTRSLVRKKGNKMENTALPTRKEGLFAFGILLRGIWRWKLRIRKMISPYPANPMALRTI